MPVEIFELALRARELEIKRRETMAVAEASYGTMRVNRIPPLVLEVKQTEDPDLRRNKADHFRKRVGERLSAYGINIDGEDTGPAIRTLIGMLLAEIDDLRAIIEAKHD